MRPVVTEPVPDRRRDRSPWGLTNTVRELATGTDLRFTTLGAVSLRGVPGQWQLFEAALDSS